MLIQAASLESAGAIRSCCLSRVFLDRDRSPASRSKRMCCPPYPWVHHRAAYFHAEVPSAQINSNSSYTCDAAISRFLRRIKNNDQAIPMAINPPRRLELSDRSKNDWVTRVCFTKRDPSRFLRNLPNRTEICSNRFERHLQTCSISYSVNPAAATKPLTSF